VVASARKLAYRTCDLRPGEPHVKGLFKRLAAIWRREEGWLILSDLAEHLGLRSREWLLAAIDEAGLKVLGRIDVKPTHPRASDETDRFMLLVRLS